MKKIHKPIVGITGASGVLGSYFIRHFKKKFIYRIYNHRIENTIKLNKWLKKNKNIEIFLHFAALASITHSKINKRKTFLINANSTIKLLKTLRRLKTNELKYFLYVSTSHVYKPSFKKIEESSTRIPINIYGKSKKIPEDFIIKNRKEFLFNIGIARIFNFYNKTQKKGFFIPDIIKKLKNKKIKTLKIKKINTLRDYINLKDIVNILLFLIKNRIDKPVNVGSGIKLNLINLVKKIKIKYKSKTKVEYESKKYPGLVANIKFLRRIGYKKAITKFNI